MHTLCPLGCSMCRVRIGGQTLIKFQVEPLKVKESKQKEVDDSTEQEEESNLIRDYSDDSITDRRSYEEQKLIQGKQKAD